MRAKSAWAMLRRRLASQTNDWKSYAPSICKLTILIDIGNTAVKWQLREAGQITHTDRGEVSQLLAWLGSLERISEESIAVSCVRDDDFAENLREALVQMGCRSVEFAASTQTYATVTNAYSNPASLGVDRWLAVLSLAARGRDRGILVDVGTACTIDVVVNHQHQGGFILPGPRLACDALVTNTDKIRFSSEPPAALDPGTDTGSCVVSGAWLTIVGAIREISLRYPECPVYLTGGAAPTLLDLGVEGVLVEDLVFDGLYFWSNGA